MGEEDAKFVSLKESPEWKDVSPIDQDDGPYPVLQIQYSDRFRDRMGYFRTVLRAREYSARSLALCREVLSLNPANYTGWVFLKDAITRLEVDLGHELSFVANFIVENPKNYQVWQHRQDVITMMIAKKQKVVGSDEVQFVVNQLKEDDKNYHAWQYFQWVGRTFGNLDELLSVSEDLLRNDPRNNSCWNFRYWLLSVLSAEKERPMLRSDDEILIEVDFALSHAAHAFQNDSVWNYLVGICSLGTPRVIDEGVARLDAALSRASSVSPKAVEEVSRWVPPRVAKFLLWKKLLAVESLDAERKKSLSESLRTLCGQLEKDDAIRREYWRLMSSQLL